MEDEEVLDRLVSEHGAVPWDEYSEEVCDDMEEKLVAIRKSIGPKRRRWIDPETGDVFELCVEMSAGLVRVSHVEFH